MNENHSSNGLTRRSFIKRSVVAAVAVSSMTIFTGLVKAQGQAASGTDNPHRNCVATYDYRQDLAAYRCWYQGHVKGCKKDYICGSLLGQLQTMSCANHISPLTAQFCDELNPGWFVV